MPASAQRDLFAQNGGRPLGHRAPTDRPRVGVEIGAGSGGCGPPAGTVAFDHKTAEPKSPAATPAAGRHGHGQARLEQDQEGLTPPPSGPIGQRAPMRASKGAVSTDFCNCTPHRRCGHAPPPCPPRPRAKASRASSRPPTERQAPLVRASLRARVRPRQFGVRGNGREIPSSRARFGDMRAGVDAAARVSARGDEHLAFLDQNLDHAPRPC